MRPWYLASLGVGALVALPAFAFAPTRAPQEFSLAWETAVPQAAFQRLEEASLESTRLDATWRAQRNQRTGTVRFAVGSNYQPAGAISNEADAEQIARDVLSANRELLSVRESEVQLRTVVHARGKYAVHFDQHVNGVPVYHGRSFVLLSDSGNVMAMGSDFFPVTDGVAAPILTSEDALAAAAASLGASIRTDLPFGADLFLVPVPQGEDYALAPAWRTKFETEEPFGLWETFVHATTGEILSRANRYHRVDVVGNVAANVQDFSYCEGISADVMSNLTVNVSGGNSANTATNGDFTITHGGASPVTITAELRGQFFNVNRFSGLGADASFSGSATPGTPEQITWSTSNARQDEVDTYFHSERAHRFMVDIDAGFDAVALPQPMTATIGRTDGFCPGNAWYSPSTKDINFCEAGSGYENTGEMGNVIYHEYGHGVSEELYKFYGSDLPSGDMHEGNSDILANYIDRNSIIGIGFQNCSGGIRDSDNNLQWPGDNNGGHFGGQIIAGFYWDAWQEMLAALPQVDADQAAWDAWHYARVLGQPLNQPDQVMWTFLADDDDGVIDNGTPHHEYFRIGAENHGFSFPPILTGIFITHEKLSHSEDGSLGFDVAAQILGSGVTLDPSELEVFYRVNDGSYQSLLMTPTGSPDEFSAHIPALGNFSEVDYYIRAADMTSIEEFDPDGAPAAFHSFDVVHEYDNAESGAGAWTLGLPGDDAFRGAWELVDPVPTLAQPGDDSTPGAGTMAFVTGQCGAPNCSGSCVMPQENSCNDVDFGTTTLLSPVYDLTGATAAKVKYDRWYSNNTGGSPGFDHWIVDVSNDGGSSWTNAEDTTTSNAAWTSQEIDLTALFGTIGQVQVRFVAADLGNDSVVEAGVDEFRILADLGGAVAAPDVAEAPRRVLSLSQNQPNPFRPATRIEYSTPTDGPVALTVYNVSGQIVRVLDEGRRAAGAYDVSWDGRDESGHRLAAGVYFYRLTTQESQLTRKLTILK